MDWLSFKGYPISRAEKLIEHNLNEIAEIIKDIDQYPIIFKRVTQPKRLDSFSKLYKTIKLEVSLRLKEVRI